MPKRTNWVEGVPRPAAFEGEKMGALLDDRQRMFAWLMACGAPSGRAAAIEAGYSNVKDGAKVQASMLMQSQKVVDAIHEASSKVLLSLAPLAINRAKRILEDEKHPAHGRMIETVLDRTGHFARTEHTMRVEHRVDTRELEAMALRLAGECGIDVKRLIGGNETKTVDLVRENDGKGSFSLMGRNEDGTSATDG